MAAENAASGTRLTCGQRVKPRSFASRCLIPFGSEVLEQQALNPLDDLLFACLEVHEPLLEKRSDHRRGQGLHLPFAHPHGVGI